MLEVEVLGRSPLTPEETAELCTKAAASAHVHDGHIAVEWVDAARIAELNDRHRGKAEATDVLSFPIDGTTRDIAGPRELGDVVICAQHTSDLREAVVHGVLHLVGMDHERDTGEMLALQRRLLAGS